jgi:hypothetical protein
MERLRGANEDRAIPEGGPNGCDASGCFDPEGAKTPEGERKQAAQPAKQAGYECNGLEALDAAGNWGEPATGGGAEKPNGHEDRPASERSSRPGPLTLEWNPRKRRPFRARERPLRANGPVLEIAAACLEALIRWPDKTVAGELRGEAHGASKCPPTRSRKRPKHPLRQVVVDLLEERQVRLARPT